LTYSLNLQHNTLIAASPQLSFVKIQNLHKLNIKATHYP